MNLFILLPRLYIFHNMNNKLTEKQTMNFNFHKKFHIPSFMLQVLVEIVLKLMGIYYKNYKRKQN